MRPVGVLQIVMTLLLRFLYILLRSQEPTGCPGPLLVQIPSGCYLSLKHQNNLRPHEVDSSLDSYKHEYSDKIQTSA